jgi:uncharacterized protein involved in response to NO
LLFLCAILVDILWLFITHGGYTTHNDLAGYAEWQKKIFVWGLWFAIIGLILKVC